MALDQSLLRMVITLFLKQENEIYSADNRYFVREGGRNPDEIKELVVWWTEKGEDAFWTRRKELAKRIRGRYSDEERLAVRNALQGALTFEDQHRHYALREWRLLQEKEQNLKLWIILHALTCMANHFQIRFGIQYGGIFP